MSTPISFEPLAHARRAARAERDVGEPHVAVRVAREALSAKSARVEPFGDSLGDDRDAVIVARRAALDDRADDRVDDERRSNSVVAELFGDHGERRAGGFAHAERQRARLAAHADAQIPAGGRARVFHQALDDFGADRARGLEAERRRVVGQRQIVVDRLGDGGDADRARA